MGYGTARDALSAFTSEKGNTGTAPVPTPAEGSAGGGCVLMGDKGQDSNKIRTILLERRHPTLDPTQPEP